MRKLVSVLGAEPARALVTEILAEIGLPAVNTPDERLKFASAMMSRGGLLEAIGRAIKIQAILHGAADPDAPRSGARASSSSSGAHRLKIA